MRSDCARLVGLVLLAASLALPASAPADGPSNACARYTASQGPRQVTVDARFGSAYELAHSGRCEKARGLFEALLADYPEAGDVDYALGWLTSCLTDLGDYPAALRRYAQMRDRFPGWVHGGCDGAWRNWDALVLSTAGEILRQRGGPEIARRVDQVDLAWSTRACGVRPGVSPPR